MLEATPQVPQHHNSGTLSELNPPYTSLDEVPIMTDYQPLPHNLPLNYGGENNAAAQSAGASHPVQHAQGAMNNTVAPSSPTGIPETHRAGGSIEEGAALADFIAHSRINFNPTHTCAVCKVTCRNNYALERHAAKERHKAFLCTCTTTFVRLATLNRHIVAQSGPQFYCDYCDGNKGFARADKLMGHLRASHKFGENAIAHFRSQARVKVQGNGHVPPTVVKTGAGQPVSTSAGYEAGSGAVSVGQAAFSAGTSSGPSESFDGGMNNFPVFSAAESQPFAPVEDCSWLVAAEGFTGFDLTGLDFSGVDFADFDGNMDLSGMGCHL